MLRSRLSAPSFALSEVDLFTPVVAPTKVMAVPANYRKHVERDTLDPGVDQGMHRAQMLDIEKPAYTYGLFLRSEEHTSELQSLMRISYAVFCLKKKKTLILQSKSITTHTQYACVYIVLHH